jgi:hypothetical protein
MAILLDLASVVLHLWDNEKLLNQAVTQLKIKLGIYRKLKFSFLLEIRSTLA